MIDDFAEDIVTGDVIRRLVPAALLATALAGLPAPAAAAGYTPEQVCGSGFVRVAGGTRPVTDQTNSLRGHVHLLYSALSGEHCVVTVKSSFAGTPTMTRAILLVEGNTILGPARYVDQGAFRYYAGPVKARANGRCVTFQGMVSNRRAGDGAPAAGINGYGGWTSYGDCGRRPLRRHAG